MVRAAVRPRARADESDSATVSATFRNQRTAPLPMGAAPKDSASESRPSIGAATIGSGQDATPPRRGRFLLETRRRDLVNEIVVATRLVAPGSHAHAAYFFHRPLRAQVPRTNHQDDATHELEGVPQHEALHFPVVHAAPVRPGQKRPADFDLAFSLVVSAESRRPDDPAVLRIHNQERTAGFHPTAEELPEHRLLIAVAGRVLLPNERIRSYRVKVVKILRSKRLEFHKRTFQNGLESERHFPILS